MGWGDGDPTPPEPTLCDELAGECALCPERYTCDLHRVPDPEELEPDSLEEEPSLTEQAVTLARRRANRDRLAVELAFLRAEFEATHKKLIERVRWWSDEVAAHERYIRDHWAETLSQEPVKGFTVYSETKLEYDAEQAVRWCIEHGFVGLLRLDATGFEKVASRLRPEFVQVRVGQRVRISRNLSHLIVIDESREASDGDGESAVRGGDGERDVCALPAGAAGPGQPGTGSRAGVRGEVGGDAAGPDSADGGDGGG